MIMLEYNTPIYRYMPLQRFLELVFKKELVLISPSKWPDEFETYWLRLLGIGYGEDALKKYIEQFDGVEGEKRKKISEICKFAYASTYCLCCSKDKDSEVLWNAHADNNKAVMVAFNQEKLLELAEDENPTIRAVEYDQEELDLVEYFLSKHSIIPEGVIQLEPEDLFLHKRKMFGYENESRLIVSTDKKTEKGILPIRIPDLSGLVEGVMLHPFADDVYVETLKLICEKYNLKFWGRSEIYKFNHIRD